MPNLTNEENWAARERLRRVEFLLWWRGWVGRQDLVETFGISPAQVSGDLQRYAGLNPGAMIYHTSRKRYETAEGMVCRLHEPVFEEALSAFFGTFGMIGGFGDILDPRLDVVALPRRRVDIGVARRLLMALLERKKLKIHYRSLSSGSDDWREVVPGGVAWDGQRWHVRAWCGIHSEWRDFVLGRIVEAGWPGEVAEELPEDVDWNTYEVICLKLNPVLTPEQRESLRIDYGLAGDRLELRVRRALKPYLLAAMFIDRESFQVLPRHFIPDV